jgi:hypothetical protein
MGSNYSTTLVSTAIEFLRVAGHELGAEFGQEKVNAMLDAFDPELKAQVFMHLLMGEYSYAPQIFLAKPGVNYPSKIEVIKVIRGVTGFGLREAKDIADAADHGPTAIKGQWTSEQRRKLATELAVYGYEVI